MISARQLLACPDQCPAKIYSLMQECWAVQPTQRPQFKVSYFAGILAWQNVDFNQKVCTSGFNQAI